MLTPDEIHQLATDGAKLEIVRLEQRLAELRAEFPAAALALEPPRRKATNGTTTTIGDELRRRAALAADTAELMTAIKPPRPPMSAKARKAISRAQKARWRNVRNGKH